MLLIFVLLLALILGGIGLFIEALGWLLIVAVVLLIVDMFWWILSPPGTRTKR